MRLAANDFRFVKPEPARRRHVGRDQYRGFTTAGASPYSTTKAGEVALMQMAALELARYRIRVNAICPGAIESKIDDNIRIGATPRPRG